MSSPAQPVDAARRFYTFFYAAASGGVTHRRGYFLLSDAKASSFGCGRRTVGRQPLDGENDDAHGHEEGTRMRLSRDECENDQ
jgi:hypothetical protein